MKTYKSYEVRIADEIVNTGIDGARFATIEGAESAADLIAESHSEVCARVKPAVFGSSDTPNITYQQWVNEPW